jgi:hypothetical protein
MPERIQRKRAKGWRMPEGAVYVGRGSKWGNPILLSDVAAQFPSRDTAQVAAIVVQDFAVLAYRVVLRRPNWLSADGTRGPIEFTYPSVEEVRSELAGKDLMCWCPESSPCHADVLLEIANGGDDRG